MDSLITAAARALAMGDPLGALNRVALRGDAPALALRGIAMAQLGGLARARELLREARRAFGPDETVARARCTVAEAEIALVSRDLGRAPTALGAARTTLERAGDRANAAHAGYLQARMLLLVGRLDDAERVAAGIDATALPPAAVVGYELVAAGIATRRLRIRDAGAAVARARLAAERTGIASLTAEVEDAARLLDVPAARLAGGSRDRLLTLEEVEALLASDALVVDACRHTVRHAGTTVPLATRPVLFALARALGEAWPADVSREALLAGAFGARHADESHRARLRVEIGRLRSALLPVAGVDATKRGFVLAPRRTDKIAVIAPPVEQSHGTVLALLADGEAWSSSALALALGTSQRTVQRALDALAAAGKVQAVGRGRARRWSAPTLPGFPTTLLLPAMPPGG
ncbi:MAG: helix-turn-helix domain-containing protein [Thalassobaculum sp.]|uniref:hypothetical protein n=1 Tax=Thalassobaculum sp. TaxID=2022740 RepID=UPI0032EB31D8